MVCTLSPAYVGSEAALRKVASGLSAAAILRELTKRQTLAELLNEIDSERPSPVAASEVSDWIQEHKSDKRYGASEARLSKEDWMIQIDGARFVADVVGELSENRVKFSKTTHSIWLTKRLLLNAPEKLAELENLLKVCVSPENDAASSTMP